MSFCWIDTCAINKSSSAELSEAINSMFNWYKNANRCYAYLSDVNDSDNRPQLLNSLSERSRWFTRGWTLQELIAPRHVEFFGAGWAHLGSKSFLRHKISELTRIPWQILTGQETPDAYSISQRMSWASSRETTRIEDMAYCLLGLFGIHMPPLYGEGSHAFIRLQEEIIKSSDDRSIFAWTSQKLCFSSFHGLLADSPKDFSISSHTISSVRNEIDGHETDVDEPYSMTNKALGIIFHNISSVRHEIDVDEPYSMTNKGLRIRMIMEESCCDGEFYASLNCRSEDSFNDPSDKMISILVRILPSQQCVRVQPNKLFFRSFAHSHALSKRSFYFRQNPIVPTTHDLRRVGGITLDSKDWRDNYGTIVRAWASNEDTTKDLSSEISWSESGRTTLFLNFDQVLMYWATDIILVRILTQEEHWVQDASTKDGNSVSRKETRHYVWEFRLAELKPYTCDENSIAKGPTSITGFIFSVNDSYQDLSKPPTEFENMTNDKFDNFSRKRLYLNSRLADGTLVAQVTNAEIVKWHWYVASFPTLAE